MFETTGIVNENILKELKKYNMSPKRKKLLVIVSIVCSLLGLLCISLALIDFNGSKTFYIIFGGIDIVLSIIGVWIIIYSSNKFHKINMDILGELYESSEFKLTVYFNEKGVIINNLSTEATIEIKYEFFDRMLETDNTYTLVTKANQYAIVFKSCLDNEQTYRFEEFIKEKCKNIK
ncbi:MAG: YcxB family protein [Aeromonas sp.]